MTLENANDGSRSSVSERAEWLVIAFILTLAFASDSLTEWWLIKKLWHNYARGYISYQLFFDLIALAFGLALALPTLQRSGLCVGRIRTHWKKVLFVCALPVLATGVVYPFLSERPFEGGHYSIWLVSPLAQDVFFGGFLYGRLEELFPDYIHERIQMRWAVVLTACFFALWHTQNFGSGMSNEYVLFQLCYTFMGYLLCGLARQWSGSIVYPVMSHMAVNLIASQAS